MLLVVWRKRDKRVRSRILPTSSPLTRRSRHGISRLPTPKKVIKSSSSTPLRRGHHYQRLNTPWLVAPCRIRYPLIYKAPKACRKDQHLSTLLGGPQYNRILDSHISSRPHTCNTRIRSRQCNPHHDLAHLLYMEHSPNKCPAILSLCKCLNMA